MARIIALTPPRTHADLLAGLLRFVLVSGCGTALILARAPWPF